MKGGGKYERECAIVRELAEAKGACVIIVGGHACSGFSLALVSSGDAKEDKATVLELANVLEQVAREIRKDMCP